MLVMSRGVVLWALVLADAQGAVAQQRPRRRQAPTPAPTPTPAAQLPPPSMPPPPTTQTTVAPLSATPIPGPAAPDGGYLGLALLGGYGFSPGSTRGANYLGGGIGLRAGYTFAAPFGFAVAVDAIYHFGYERTESTPGFDPVTQSNRALYLGGVRPASASAMSPHSRFGKRHGERSVATTPEEIGRLVALYAAGHTIHEIVRATGVGKHTVRDRLVEAGVEIRLGGCAKRKGPTGPRNRSARGGPLRVAG